MSDFVLGYLDWEGRLRTGEEADANSRSSQNAVKAKFGRRGCYLPNTLRHQGPPCAPLSPSRSAEEWGSLHYRRPPRPS